MRTKDFLFILAAIICSFAGNGCSSNNLEMRFEIKNPNKPHTFTFNVAPEKHPFYYFGRVSGNLDGSAQITRSFDCRYDSGKNCDSLRGITLRTIKLEGGNISIGDTTDYYGGKVILKYIPHGSVKGKLFIDVRVP